MSFAEIIAQRQTQSDALQSELFKAYDVLQTQYNTLQVRYGFQKLNVIESQCKANYWQTQCETFQSENEALKAALRKREQQLFGRKAEQVDSKADSTGDGLGEGLKVPPIPPKKRGQQKGSKGHGQRNYGHLTAVDEIIVLSSDESKCPCCHLPFTELSATEDSEKIEIINVKAYRRVVRRKKYQRSCDCPVAQAGGKLITAPVPPQLIPKSRYGVSLWAFLLIKKYVYQNPLSRGLKELSDNGLSIAMGSIIDGWKKILPLLEPVYDAIVLRNQMTGDHWHADETGWKVFEAVEGKETSRWWLWIFKGIDTVIYKLDPTRAACVPLSHFGEKAKGFLSVDRYSAYKVIAQKGVFVLAFCWAHVRRDFLSHAKGYPAHEAWGLSWVERIGTLYHLNNQRLLHGKDTKGFKTANTQLKTAVDKFKTTLANQLADTGLLPSSRKCLVSLNNHWEGLTVFVERPDIPMDNNVAERGLRPSVIGRKNYYGSGAVWAADLAALMFSLIETLKYWKINPHTWLLAYFNHCALSGGVPNKIDTFLPWNMTELQKELFANAPIGEDSG
jgi:transposase